MLQSTLKPTLLAVALLSALALTACPKQSREMHPAAATTATPAHDANALTLDEGTLVLPMPGMIGGHGLELAGIAESHLLAQIPCCFLQFL